MTDTITDETLRKILADECLIAGLEVAAKSVRAGGAFIANSPKSDDVALAAMRFCFEFGKREERRARSAGDALGIAGPLTMKPAAPDAANH